MIVEQINDKNFKSAVLESKIPVIVDFWAQWCGPCRKLTPVLEQIQNEFKNKVKIVQIDADKNIQSAKDNGVVSLPSLLMFKDGEVKEIMAGMVPRSAIISSIKKLIS